MKKSNISHAAGYLRAHKITFTDHSAILRDPLAQTIKDAFKLTYQELWQACEIAAQPLSLASNSINQNPVHHGL